MIDGRLDVVLLFTGVHVFVLQDTVLFRLIVASRQVFPFVEALENVDALLLLLFVVKEVEAGWISRVEILFDEL